MPLCIWGGSFQDVGQPMRTAGHAWPAMLATRGHAHGSERFAQLTEELAEAHAGAQVLRDHLRSANDKAALLLSYRDAADQEHRRIRDDAEALQVCAA
jgi:hypothetical protein